MKPRSTGLRRIQATLSDPAIALALLYLIAATQGLLIIALPHWRIDHPGLVVAVGVAAIATSLGLLLFRTRLQAWMLYAFTAAGLIAATVAVYACGAVPSSMSAALFYFWVVLYASAFFGPVAAAAFTVAAGVAYGLTIVVSPTIGGVAQWLQMMVVLVGCAAIVASFAAGLRRSRARAHASAARLSRLADAVPVGIAEVDGDMRVIFANETIGVMLGVSLVGLTLDEIGVRLVDERDGPELEQAMVTTRTGRRARVIIRTRGADGTQRWKVLASAPEMSSSGEFIGAYVSLIDITAMKQIEAELAERAAELETANEEVRRSNEELEQFAYVASHDLREPLRAIEQPLSLLADRYAANLGPDAGEWIGFAVDGCHRMQQMIDSLLAYSRVGRLEGELQVVDSRAVMADVITDLSSAIKDADATVRVGALPVLETEPVQLHAVLQNLVSNALKFVPADRSPVVTVDAQRCGSMWRFTVTDNGIGIAPDQRERIFGMFKRLHSRDKYPGSGIGLSIVKKTVERRGGHIGVEDAPDGPGSRFWFTLPAMASEPAAAAETQLVGSASATAPAS